jgi:hypothetical protein
VEAWAYFDTLSRVSLRPEAASSVTTERALLSGDPAMAMADVA